MEADDPEPYSDGDVFCGDNDHDSLKLIQRLIKIKETVTRTLKKKEPARNCVKPCEEDVGSF